MLTAKDAEVDIVVGLELGADDYVTKPYSSRELLARIRAVLRRRVEASDAVGPDVLESGSVRLDADRHAVFVRGAETAMPLKEFELLELLLRNAGRVLTRGQLIDRVWGSDYFGDTKTLDVHIKRIRAKIEDDPGEPRLLLTVRGPRLPVRGLPSRPEPGSDLSQAAGVAEPVGVGTTPLVWVGVGTGATGVGVGVSVWYPGRLASSTGTCTVAFLPPDEK